MTSVEKRRSGRKGGLHRKHSDGGYSDTSSGGSFLDETDREVSNLTDRAFRSLCIGDEAVYNDSDLCSSSPCIQRERQLAFGQCGLSRDSEDREDLKRAAHESFSLRVQQYGQDWIHEGLYGAEMARDPQWEVYGRHTQGRLSATFQNSFMETSQQQKSLREEHLSFLSNGATDLCLQQGRSRSRVSSLIRAFNSDGHMDGSGMDGKLREWNDEPSWDKSALMSIQRELSEFSYQQGFNNGHFPSAGPFSSRDTSYYSSEVASVTHMNSDSSFMRSSHSTHSLSAQVNCKSNFFIHSEYSPFKVWRDHNRFPFKQGELSGFMPRSEFPKWYETPMYKELSLETRPQDAYRFAERGINNLRTNLASAIHPTPPRSTSTSTVLQRTLAVEKRCESELASHYPHRKRTQSLGNNRLPSQRPSTASPTTEMSQRVRDTIRSTEALRQKIKMMAEQNMATGITTNQQAAICSANNFGGISVPVPPNVVNSKSSTTPFNISQLLTPVVHAHQGAETSEVAQSVASPQPIEHPPVRAESRGATPDVRMSSYKSRATSLLFNLKDNRKRVKSTYSPTKFKGPDAQERNKQLSLQEPRDTVIDMPDYSESDIQFPHAEQASRTNAALHQHVNQYQSTGSARTTQNSYFATASMGHNPEYDYQASQTGETAPYSGFADVIADNCASSQIVNGQNLQEGSLSSAQLTHRMVDHDHAHGLKAPNKGAEYERLNTDNNQFRDYSMYEAKTEQVEREFTNMERYQQPKDNKYDYSDVSSQERWRPTISQDTEMLSLKAAISPWKQEITALIEKDQRAAVIKENLNASREEHGGRNLQRFNRELKQTVAGESFDYSYRTNASVNPDTNQLPQYAPLNNNRVERQTHYGDMEVNQLKENYASYERYSEQETRHKNQHNQKGKTTATQETVRREQHIQVLNVHESQSLQSIEPKPQLSQHVQDNSLSPSDSGSIPSRVKDRQFDGVKAEQAKAEHIKVEHAQAELARTQPWAQVEQPKVESARLILAEHTSSEKVREEEARAGLAQYRQVEPAKSEQDLRETQAGVKKVTKEPGTMKETGALHLKEDESGQVKPEKAKLDKTEPVKRDSTGPARAEQNNQAMRGKLQETQVKVEHVREEKVEIELREAEHIETERHKDAKSKKAEQAKLEEINGQKATAGQEKLKTVEEEELKENCLKAEDVREGKNNKDLIEASQVNADKSATQTSKPKEQQAKSEQTKVELGKTKYMQEKWNKPAAKLTMAPPIRMEPDRVEQVKTELAKAKAELAKIKEKMRGEHKEKARNVSTKEDNNRNRDGTSGVNIHQTNDHRVKENTTQTNPQKEESALNRTTSDKVERAADDYERLREKYGFTNPLSENKNKVPPVDDQCLHSNKEAESALGPDEVEALNAEQSKRERSPTTADTGNKGMTEGLYVYSESAKDFQLANPNSSPADKRLNTGLVGHKTKDKLAKCDSVKQTDVSQQRDPDLTKPLPLERKPKSVENSSGSSKESHFTPPRALSHKDRVQTKQEILTSKIKAHAEKEISAIKEKGFAMRDGFIPKNSIKTVSGGQSTRQRPAVQEMSKKNGGTVSSNITPKHQMEPLGTQMAADTSVSPLSPGTTPSGSQLVDHSQKPTGFVLGPHLEAKQTRRSAMSTDQGLLENQKKEKSEGNHEKQKLKDNLVADISCIEKETENRKEVETKQEAVPEESEPLLNLAFGQIKGPAADDSVQIVGITVSVRERKTSLNEIPVENSPQDPKNTEEKESWNLDKSHPSSNSVLSKEKTSSMEMSAAKTKDTDGQETHPTVKKDQTDVVKNNHHVEGASALGIGKSENFTEKVNSVQTKSSVGLKPQKETLDTPLSEKGTTPPVTVPAKNKGFAETQPLLCKVDNTAKEIVVPQTSSAKITKMDEIKSNTEQNSPHKERTTDTNDQFMGKVLSTSIKDKNDSYRAGFGTVTNHDVQLKVKEVKPFRHRDIDGKVGSLLEEKSLDSQETQELNKTSPSNNLTPNENMHVSQNLQHTGSNIEENIDVDENVHIDGIAIKVVPAVKRDKMKTTSVPADVVRAEENKQAAISIDKVKVKTSENEHKNEDLTPASTEKNIQTSLENELGVQYVLSAVRKLSESLKTSNQQNSINEICVKNQTGDEKPGEAKKSVSESQLKSLEEDYFQIQGLTNIGDFSDVALQSKDKDTTSSESVNQFVKQNKRVESSFRRENIKNKNPETQNHLDSKQSDYHKDKTLEVDEADHSRKHHTESQSILTTRERSRSRSSHPPMETAVKEKPKGRTTAIPEISAIADYARLKVIVSEDRENKAEEFSPNKKEGFFPLIQTRPSRRPVFTADPKHISEKQKGFQNKTEVNANVTKEPKGLVFPITEKEHQRTGMFKLGDKEKQEKLPSDVKSKGKPEQRPTETNKPRLSQIDQNILEPDTHALQNMSSSTARTSRNIHDGSTYVDRNSHSQSTTTEQMHNIKVGMTTLKRNERDEKATEDTKTDKVKDINSAALQEEITAKQLSRVTKLEKQLGSKMEQPKRTEKNRGKAVMEENGTSRVAEGKESNQREDRKGRERETRSKEIQEKQQRQTERIAEEEKQQQREEQRAAMQLRARQREEDMRRKQDEEKRRIQSIEETRTKLRAAHEDQLRGAEQEEHQKRAAQEEHQKRAAQEEHQKRAAQEENLRRAAQEEHQKRAAQEEHQKRAAQEEHQRRAAQEEHQKRAAQEEHQRRAAQEEHQKRAAQEENLRRAAQEEHQKRAAQEEHLRRAAQEEHQKRAAQEEHQRRAAQEEHQRRAAQEEHQRRAAQEENLRRAAQEEHLKRAAQEENLRRAAQEEQHNRISQEEQQRRAAQSEHQRRIGKERQRGKAEHEEHKLRASLSAEQMQVRQLEEKRFADGNEQNNRKQGQMEAAQILEEERLKHIQGQKKSEWQTEEFRQETAARVEGSRLFGESHAALKDEDQRVTLDQRPAPTETEIRAKRREEEIKLETHREKDKGHEAGQQKRPQMTDTLQYYAITSTEPESKPRVAQPNNASGLEDSHSRPNRPQAATSPASSLPRSNTSSPALGAKPSMFRVKDNTIRGSSLTRSVKPRFHKNLGDDFRVGSPMERGLERGEEEPERSSRSTVTPVHLDTGFNRLGTIKESTTFHPTSSQDHPAPLPQHRPYSRRSIALDEDDSRSVISNMSEDAESFASCATDVANLRGLHDYDRPDSACSFSSDVSRSLGRPPAVPPKSEKALQRAKRLTSKRMKKELSKAAADGTGGVEKPPHEVSSNASPACTEVHSSNRHAVASPHFSPPVSLAHAPTPASSLSSSHTEHQTSHGSPHATGPISLPAAMSHATTPVSLTSPLATSSAYNTATPKTVAHMPSSPTLHHANQPAPVTKYHVEPSYPQSYPLTQRKVLQDLGSGQYYVVDVPVEVKTKTFFDPETGKYVQLNVRESGQSTSRPQGQQTYPQPQLPPPMQVKLQQQPLSQSSPAGKTFLLYQGYHGYPQNCQPVNSVPPHGSSVTLHQDPQSVRSNPSCPHPAPESVQNSEGPRYSPEKTPYMDTVSNTEKTRNRVYNAPGSYEAFPECDTNSQLAESSVCENENSAHPRYQPCDIITMSELEDFMDASDW